MCFCFSTSTPRLPCCARFCLWLIFFFIVFLWGAIFAYDPNVRSPYYIAPWYSPEGMIKLVATQLTSNVGGRSSSQR